MMKVSRHITKLNRVLHNTRKEGLPIRNELKYTYFGQVSMPGMSQLNVQIKRQLIRESN